MSTGSTSFIRHNWRALPNVIGNTFNIYEKFRTGRTMEALIEEIVRKLHHLPEVKILEVLDFVEFLTWNKERSISQQVESDVTSQEDQEFEAIAN